MPPKTKKTRRSEAVAAQWAPSVPSFEGSILRAQERVRSYLDKEFQRDELRDGARLPTSRALAQRLQVSVSTVQAVFRKLVAEGRIQTKVGSGSFLIGKSRKATEQFRVGLSYGVASDAGADIWQSRIGGAILHAASAMACNISIVPLRHEASSEKDVVGKVVAKRSEMDGLILFPHAFAGKIRHIYEEARLPVVDLNPSSELATANFVSPNYMGACSRIAEAWKKTGRQRIALIQSSPMGPSASNYLRASGMVAGLGCQLGVDVMLRIHEVPSTTQEAGYDFCKKLFFDRATAPDAIFCMGDFLALGVFEFLRDQGISVPQEVSVIGGTGLDLRNSPCPGLTVAQQPFEQIGEALLAMLWNRMEHEGAPHSGKYIEHLFMGGATTRPEENRLLKLA